MESKKRNKTTDRRQKTEDKRVTSQERRAANKVWCIFHFENRFEMDKRYRRKGGLDFVRMFVTATTEGMSNESSSFMQQLDELEHYYPCERDALEGRFWRLCRLTATKEDWLRGYLLDSDNKPLTAARLAARLHLSLADMKKTLNSLRKVGLLEYIDMPELTEPKRQNINVKKPKNKSKNTNTQSVKKPHSGTQKAAQEGDLQIFTNVPQSFKNRNKNRIKSEVNNKINKEIEFNEKKQKLIASLSAADGKTSQGQGQGEPPTTPTAAPPINSISSTKADEPGQDVKDNRMSRPPDNSIGKIVNMQSYRYSQDATDFALDIIRLLGIINADEYNQLRTGSLYLTNVQAKERGNWQAAWSDAAGQFGPDTMEKLRAGIIKRVPVAHKRGPETGTTPEKYLRKCWNNLCKDIRRKTKKSRASPAM